MSKAGLVIRLHHLHEHIHKLKKQTVVKDILTVSTEPWADWPMSNPIS